MEQWKIIPWFNSYEASTYWRIRNKIKGNILVWWFDTLWYRKTILSKSWKAFTKSTHRLILITFKWFKSNLECNHIDWDRSNSRLDNLEWVTHSENMIHRFEKLWFIPYYKWKTWANHCRSIPVKQYKDWVLINTFESQNLASISLWIRQWWISQAIKTWCKAWWYYFTF